MGATLSNLCQGTRLHFHVTVIFVTAVIYTSSLLEIVLELETEGDGKPAHRLMDTAWTVL